MKLVPPPMSSRKTFTPGSSSLSLTSVLVLHTSALFCGEMMLGIGPASTAGGHYALGGGQGCTLCLPPASESVLSQWEGMKSHL